MTVGGEHGSPKALKPPQYDATICPLEGQDRSHDDVILGAPAPQESHTDGVEKAFVFPDSAGG